MASPKPSVLKRQRERKRAEKHLKSTGATFEGTDVAAAVKQLRGA